ncbi:MAG: hypothetical protein IPK13_13675 [Deltaproteobacteria bacterium]|nr:hypothetical protein [Deltaproteobacteria bacterium]
MTAPTTPLRDSASQLELSIPNTWQPDHVYRFTIPDEADAPLPGALRVRNSRGGGGGGGFRSNLIVCRVPLREGQSFERLFDAANDAKRAQDRSFEVLRSGLSATQGRRLVWQDSASVAGPNRTKIFQREFGIEEADQAVTMCVFTSDKNNLDKLSRSVFGDAVDASPTEQPTGLPAATPSSAPLASSEGTGKRPSSAPSALAPRRPTAGARVGSRSRT